MKSVFLFGTARQNSSRFPGKMTRKFCIGESLFDNYLFRMSEVIRDSMEFVSGYGVGLYVGDSELVATAEKIGFPVLERNEASVAKDAKIQDVMHFLSKIDSKYVCWVNGCLPLFPPDLICEGIKTFCNDNSATAMTVVKVKKNWFWSIDKDGMHQTNANGGITSTQEASPVYESVHAFHIYNKDFLLSTGTYWDNDKNRPTPFIVEDGIQCLDVDYEWEWQIIDGVLVKGRANE